MAGRAVALTATEFELAARSFPGRRPGPEPRDPAAPGLAERAKDNPKIVRAYVKRLRGKLGDDAARPRPDLHERGVGYRMARPGDP